jgi:MFS family permease
MTGVDWITACFHGPALPAECQHTYRRHLAYAVLDAVAAGILANAPLMALKGMGSPDWQMALNLTISSIGMFLVLYLGGVMAPRAKMPFVVVPGIAYAGTCILMALTNNVLLFLVLSGIGTLLETVARPAITAVIRLNYPATHRGAATGEIRRWHSIVFLATSLLSAWAMDFAGSGSSWMIKSQMILAGVVSVLSFLIFRAIRVNERPTESAAPGHLQPFAEAWQILRRDARFRRYLGIGFLYAFGAMVYVSFLPVLFGRQLRFSYLMSSFLIHILPGVLAFAATGAIGRWIDRVNPWKAWAIIRLGWGLDPVILAATLLAGPHTTGALALSVAARVSRGVVMGGSWILWWQVGVNHFAPPGGDTTRYLGMVLFINGLARLFGPITGAWLLTTGSLAAALWVGGAIVLLSALLSLLEYRRERGADRFATMAEFEESCTANDPPKQNRLPRS